MEQVLFNLFSNALRALRGQRGGEIRVTAQRSTWNTDGDDADAPVVAIQVTDTGPGIPASLLRTLFDPFVSGDGGRCDPEEARAGAGLGLAICRRVVEGAGGAIEAANSGGGSAVFTITLPEASAEAAARAA